MILLVDDSTDICNLFIELGCVPVRYSHWGINTGQTNTIGAELKSYKYRMVWINHPKLSNKQRTYAHMTCLVNWAVLCSQLGIPYVMFGSFGKKWNDPQLIAATDSKTLHKRHHRLCHYGLTVDPSLKGPSSVCYITLSTVVLPAHPCRCEVSQTEHTMDLKSAEKNSATLSDAAQVKLVAKMLPDLMSEVNRTTATYPTLNDNSTTTDNHDKPLPEVPTFPGLQDDHTSTDKTSKIKRQQRKAANRTTYFSDNVASFPTDSRERQKVLEKERKAAGIEPVKKNKFVEDHSDDCGTDISGLGPDALNQYEEYHIELVEQESEPDSADELAFNLNIIGMRGTEWDNTLPFDGEAMAHRVGYAYQLVQVLFGMGKGVDVVELCGGAGRVSKICVRRRLNTGENFDIVVGCDLNDPQTQKDVRHYYISFEPLFSIQAPTCTPFGSFARLNYHTHYDAWLRSYHEAAPHGRFCGEMALLQDQAGRYWLNEQPAGSWLYYEPPWPRVLALPSTVAKIFDQCMVGQVGPSGLPVLKSTELKANSQLMLAPFEGLTCDKSHDHEPLQHGKAAACKLWTWDMSQRIVDGMVLVKRYHKTAHGSLTLAEAYPEAEAAPPGPRPRGRPPTTEAGRAKAAARAAAVPGVPMVTPEAGAASRLGAVRPKFDRAVTNPYSIDPTTGKPLWRNCPGCRGKQHWSSHLHDRAPHCKFQDHEASTFDCPACKQNLRCGDDGHTCDGDCRWTPEQHRIARGRDITVRTGRHPREAARPDHRMPEGDAQPQLPDGTDLGESEERIRDPPPEGGTVTPPAEGQIVPYRAPRSGAAGSRDIVPVHRGAFRDAMSGTVEPYDWTRFNISNSLRALRLGTKEAKRTLLRKLHLRWWHASVTAMTTTLKAAGVPEEIIKMIPEVVHSCRECRAWLTPKPRTIPSMRVSLRFNQHVEMDLMFYKKEVILHLIDRCTRWHSGMVLRADIDGKKKSLQNLIDGIYDCWLKTHGPMEVLYVDGESSLSTPGAKEQLKRDSIEIEIRAPNQHAQFIERRGAILRHTMHCMEEQAAREGLTITIVMLLGQAIFAGNALTSVGGATPYQGLYGRQPAMLPPLPDPENTDTTGETPGGRVQARIKEIAAEKMIQATSLARANRTMRSKTRASDDDNYQAGDLVDFYRHDGPKDEHGWHGPVKVIENKAEAGQVIIKINGQPRPNRYQDTRHTLLVYCSFATGIFYNAGDSWSTLASYTSGLKIGTVITLGVTKGVDGEMVLAKANKAYEGLILALDYYCRNVLQLTGVTCVRLSKGLGRLRKLDSNDGSHLLYWHKDDGSDLQCYESDSTAINITAIDSNYSHARIMQIVCGGAGEQLTEIARKQDQRYAPEPVDQDVGGADAESAGRLSTIDEDSQEDAESIASFIKEYFGDATPDMYADLREVYYAFQVEDLNEAIPVHDSGARLRKPPQGWSQPDCPDESSHFAHYFSAEKLDAWSTALGPSGTYLLTEDYQQVGNSMKLSSESYYAYGHMEPSSRSEASTTAPSSRDDAADLEQYACVEEFDEQGNGYTEFYISRDMAKCFIDDSNIKEDEVATMRVYLGPVKQAIIKRESDLLTKEELIKHDKDVKAAILEELQTWIKYGNFQRAPIRGARNIMDSRFVAKWKVKFNDKTKTRYRIIRMRMVMRGFKDWDADTLETYAGTASRLSQRLLVSEVACHPDWEFLSVDVEKAFLQGITYKELSEKTGEPEREVHFTLPPGAAQQLRLCKGYEDFDETSECLKCIKPGTGCKDAPRCFSLKLAEVTQAEDCGMTPTAIDPELEMLYEKDKGVTMLMTKHVDDLKIGGLPPRPEQVLLRIEKVFGPMARNKEEFTNCGVHQKRHSNGDIEWDQDEYIKDLIPIQHPDLVGRKPEDTPSDHLTAMFWSLLGALAYALTTQHWLAVYVVALQRVTQCPKVGDIRKLNVYVRMAQVKKAHILFRAMKCLRLIDTHSDSSFKKEQEKGYGMRGANYLRKGQATPSGEHVWHLLQSECKSHKLVTRSTFSSETLAAVGAADTLIMLLVTMHELQTGPLTKYQSRMLREEGGLCFRSILTVDAMSLFAAIAATTVKIPSEKNLAGHLFWLRELIDRKVLSQIQWADTRDMSSDGHTKGSIDRQMLLDVMLGKFTYQHKTLLFPTTYNA